MKTYTSLAILAALAATTPAAAQPTTAQPDPAGFTVAEARASLAGRWTGKLEYRDYQEDRWFGLPVTIDAELVADGVTLIQRAAFDDGPKTGTVHITTVSILGADGSTEQTASFRAGQTAELGSAALRLTGTANGTAADTTHWTMIAERVGEDDDRPAHIRETSTRDGDTLVTLKEVDFTDDDGEHWLARNRTTLERLGD